MEATFRISHIAPLLTLIPILSSCSSDISREEAAELIKEHLELTSPRIETMDFLVQDGTIGRSVSYADWAEFERMGLVIRYPPPTHGRGQAWVRFTEQGQEFVMGEDFPARSGANSRYVPVRTSTIEFGEVTGISSNPNALGHRQIEFSIVRKNLTPFFRPATQPTKEHHTLEVEHYDDGWRVVPNTNRTTERFFEAPVSSNSGASNGSSTQDSALLNSLEGYWYHEGGVGMEIVRNGSQLIVHEMNFESVTYTSPAVLIENGFTYTSQHDGHTRRVILSGEFLLVDVQQHKYFKSEKPESDSQIENQEEMKDNDRVKSPNSNVGNRLPSNPPRIVSTSFLQGRWEGTLKNGEPCVLIFNDDSLFRSMPGRPPMRSIFKVDTDGKIHVKDSRGNADWSLFKELRIVNSNEIEYDRHARFYRAQ